MSLFENMFPLTSNIVTISFFLTIAGIITYYFGRNITDARPYKTDRFINHLEGLLFIIVYILVPILLISEIRNTLYSFKIDSLAVLIINLILLKFLDNNVKIRGILKAGLSEKVAKIIKDRTKEKMDRVPAIKHIATSEMNRGSKFAMSILFYRIGNIYVLAISAIIGGTLLSILDNLTISLSFVVAMLTIFINYSLLAQIYGNNTGKSQMVDVYLTNGEIISGSWWKYDGEFLVIGIISKNEIVSLNKNQIVKIITPMVNKKQLDRL